MTGIGLSPLLKACCKSSPETPGIFKSAITQPRASGVRSPRNFVADGNVFTSKPAARNKRDTAERNEVSSSTMWTVGTGEDMVVSGFSVQVSGVKWQCSVISKQ